MNNSTVCTYIYNGNVFQKKKYKTAEEAHEAAKQLNANPKTIHKFGEYKCMTCFRFHIGKTKKFTDNISLFRQSIAPETVIEIPPVEEVVVEAETVEIKEIIEPLPEPGHDEFDWDSGKKKTIKKL